MIFSRISLAIIAVLWYKKRKGGDILWQDLKSTKSNGVCLATVTNTVKKYFEGGIDAVTEFKRNVNSDNARRVLDGRAEARIIELACGPVPEGHSRWTIRLLEEKSRIVLDTPVSREAIRRALKKTNFDLTKTTTGASPQKMMLNLSR